MLKKNIAGLALTGGRKDNFFFCLLEYFPERGRWFLRSVLHVNEERETEGVPATFPPKPSQDALIREWAIKYDVSEIVVDFPLTTVACQTCELSCPGQENCQVEEVRTIKDRIASHLQLDQELYQKNPKKYEQMRESLGEFVFNRNSFEKKTTDPILSKPFKRRLKKGHLPYWNRPLDLWVWEQYYDPMLEIFNLSYDSFASTSLMLQNRFSYLRRHFPDGLKFFEGSSAICLLELMRAGIVKKNHLKNLLDLEIGPEARLDIIRSIEQKLNIFVYDNDLEILVKQPKAFESFLLALVGQSYLTGKKWKLPDWTFQESESFLCPQF